MNTAKFCHIGVLQIRQLFRRLLAAVSASAINQDQLLFIGKLNNGLTEGSVNKIKLMKRIMYGRNSFRLLKAKILLNEYYYQIN